MARKVEPEDFAGIVGVFNKEGRKAALQYIKETFGIHYPGCVLKRIEEKSDYIYDAAAKQFIKNSDAYNDTDVFMSLDDLCRNNLGRHTIIDKPDIQRAAALEKLTRDLISDRLLELSRYLSLDPVSRTLFIDETSLASDGYKIATY